MALKFRRGTTAQQSGSLAFGEPYVNTTLGTLLIGGPDGDIVLSSTGTGSAGNFGPISGSGLDITGNGNIHGDLTLGGKLTIGDATSDTINVVASISSSLIPATTNVFDIGSADKVYKTIHGDTISGSRLTIQSGSNPQMRLINNTTDIQYHIQNGDGGNFQIHRYVDDTDSLLFLFQSSSIDAGSQDGYFYSNVFVSKSVTANAFRGAEVTASSLSGSLVGIGNVAQYSSSVNSKIEALSTSTGSTSTRLTNLESTSASVNISVSNLNSTTASLNTSVSNLNSFTSSQLTQNVALATISGSLITSASNLTQRVGAIESVSGTFARTNSNNTFSGLQTFNNINVDGTASFAFIQSTTGSSTSIGEAFIVLNTSTPSANFAGIKVVDSGSSFTTASLVYDGLNNNWVFEKANVGSSDTSIAIFGPVSNGGLGTELGLTQNKLPKAVSSHGHHIADSQISDDGTTVSIGGALTVTGDITGPIKATNGVVSGSSQVIGILTSLNSYTASNDTTNTTQNSRLDQLSTASGSAISRLTALEVAEANLETFSASALTRLSTLEGKDITIALTGDVTGTGTITDLGNVSFATTIAANSVALGTDTTGNYVASLVAGTNITLSNNSGEGATPTIGLTNNTISGISLGSNLATLTIGTGLSGTSYNGSTGVTIANTGVTSNVAGTGVTVSGATGAVTISIGQAVATSDNVRFNSLGIGMAASATAGRIDAANDIVAFSSSDIRFKENIKPIENALDKICKISGNTYDWKAENKAEHGYEGNDVGVIAQEIEAVLPQLVQNRDNGYKAVKYDKLVALLIEGIKEQQIQIEELKAKIGL
jgi:hypothetical protein